MGAIAVGIRKSTYLGADWKLQMCFRAAWVNVALNETPPTRLRAGDDEPFYVAYTEELTVVELAYIGNFAAKITKVPAGYEVPLRDPEGPQAWRNVDWESMRPQIKSFCENPAYDPPALVLPGDPGWPTGEEANFYQAILDANGAPSWILAADRIPETWGYPDEA